MLMARELTVAAASGNHFTTTETALVAAGVALVAAAASLGGSIWSTRRTLASQRELNAVTLADQRSNSKAERLYAARADAYVRFMKDFAIYYHASWPQLVNLESLTRPELATLLVVANRHFAFLRELDAMVEIYGGHRVRIAWKNYADSFDGFVRSLEPLKHESGTGRDGIPTVSKDEVATIRQASLENAKERRMLADEMRAETQDEAPATRPILVAQD
jgi:hypothetical protein